MRTVFFGTPEIAVPALKALAETSELVGVVCQPDRPAGRGLELREPAIKRAARELGIEVHQPVKVKTGSLHEWLADRRADVAVVLAYGRILPPEVLAAPRRGCMNLHASLLPSYRGAAPIQWAIVRGETETGISLMQMDQGLDTGPVYVERSLSILPEETAGELAVRLAELADRVVREDLGPAVAGELEAVPQDEAHASLAPLIERAHARIDWSRDARSIVNLARGMAPRPGAFTSLRGKVLRIAKARTLPEAAPGAPGAVSIREPGRILVSAGEGTVELLRAQLEGKRELWAEDLVNGRAVRHGDLLGASSET
jgi:methionyl-tRNA formyltransferase